MSTPSWFTDALAQRPEHRDVVVAGARVAYRVWGPPEGPGVVLVHGGAAHSGWWDHVAPLLTGHRVVALDLTGHGDSDRRAEYDPLLWAREVVAVAAAAGLTRPVVIGHSMGGWVATTVGVEHAAEVASVVVIDSPLNDQPPDEARLPRAAPPAPGVPDAGRGGGALPHAAPAGRRPPLRPRPRGPRLAAPARGWLDVEVRPGLLRRPAPLRDLLPRPARR